MINSKEAIDRTNEMKQFFLTKKDDNSNVINLLINIEILQLKGAFSSNQLLPIFKKKITLSFLNQKIWFKCCLSLSFCMGISI